MADLRTIVGQHARTAQLLGVDFVPVYRRAGAGGEHAANPATAGESAPVRAFAGRDRAAVRRELDAIRARYEAEAPHAAFVTDHHSIVFDDGDPCARLMFVGEAPGADEDRVGRPFVGKAGQLLDKMIVAMGLKREEVYIANVLKTRPPGNATPTTDEAQACAPYLFEQIAVVRPEVIVTLGLVASRTLLRTEATMSSMRGRWTAFVHPDEVRFPDLRIDLMPTFHPAFLLRQYTPENRAKVWSDLQQVMAKLGLGE